jgi:hypothetical protein
LSFEMGSDQMGSNVFMGEVEILADAKNTELLTSS